MALRARCIEKMGIVGADGANPSKLAYMTATVPWEFTATAGRAALVTWGGVSGSAAPTVTPPAPSAWMRRMKRELSPVGVATAPKTT